MVKRVEQCAKVTGAAAKGLTPAEALALAVGRVRQAPLDFGIGHEPGVNESAKLIVELIRAKSPRGRAKRRVADGKRCLSVYEES
jgi:adenine/guanine phosphoribosyltransferase-like PRPP-binding protein